MNARFDVVAACSFEGDGSVNEDFFGWTEKAAWVLDGATGVSRETLPYPSDAYWFVRTFSGYLHSNLVTNPHRPTIEVINQAVSGTRQRYEEIKGSEVAATNTLPSAAFAMIRIMGESLEIWSLGDCKALFRDDAGAVRIFYDPSLEPFENRTLKALQSLREDRPDSPQSDLVSDLRRTIRENRKSMNRAGGYRALSLNDIDESAIESTSISLRDDGLVVLATDGFLRYTEVFEQGSHNHLYEKLFIVPPASIMNRVREIEADDANCRRFIRVKKSDDATCLIVKVTRNRA